MWREHSMAAMKPRTGDGPLEATKEGRGIVMRVPLEGGGRLVVELTPDEATALGDGLKRAVGGAGAPPARGAPADRASRGPSADRMDSRGGPMPLTLSVATQPLGGAAVLAL